MLSVRFLSLILFITQTSYAEDFLYRIPSLNDVLERQGNFLNYVLDPTFKIMVWNNYKGEKKDWNKDYNNLKKNKDILLLQEYYSKTMDDFELDEIFSYDIATSFIYLKEDYAKTGVSTGANTKAYSVFFDRSYYTEPIINTPKVSIFTTYDLRDCADDLLVVNTHAINFVTHKKFRHQIRSIANKISMHQGPVIWAGDFNTWTSKKLNSLKSIAQSIGLTFIEKYKDDQRLRMFNKPLDHILFKDLNLIEAKVEASINSSDHKPLVASFKTKCNEV